MSTFYGQDNGLSRDGGGVIAQPIIGAIVGPPHNVYPPGSGFTIEIFSDNDKWLEYAGTLQTINDANGDAQAVMYYQLAYSASGSSATKAVVTNRRCKEMCEVWGECVTYEYFRYDGNKPSGTHNPDGTVSNPAEPADKLMRCELWVHPDADHLTSARLGAAPNDVWCGAAGGGMHDDTSRTPQNWPDLESKGDVPWPPISRRRRRQLAGELPAPAKASAHGRKLTDLQTRACNRLMGPGRAGGHYGVDTENGCFVSYFNLEQHNRPNPNPFADRNARSVGIDAYTGEWTSSFMCVLVPWAPPPPAPSRRLAEAHLETTRTDL